MEQQDLTQEIKTWDYSERNDYHPIIESFLNFLPPDIRKILTNWDNEGKEIIQNLCDNLSATFENLEHQASLKLPSRYKHIHSWKVRETYENPDNPNQLIIIATDRISTHDVVHKNIIPWKGKALTQISKYWFQFLSQNEETKHIPTQVVENASFPTDFPENLKERTIIVKKLKALPIEAIVRWFLAWSAAKWYNSKTGTLVTGEFVGKWLKKYDELKAPLFTPSTKGKDDINISFEEMVTHLEKWCEENEIDKEKAREYAEQIKEYSLIIYKKIGEEYKKKWFIFWDTKFEFAIDENWKLHLIDETATPDSSRIWDLATFSERIGQWEDPIQSDKQPVRNYVEEERKKHPENNKKPILISRKVVWETQENYCWLEEEFKIEENTLETEDDFMKNWYNKETITLNLQNQEVSLAVWYKKSQQNWQEYHEIIVCDCISIFTYSETKEEAIKNLSISLEENENYLR